MTHRTMATAALGVLAVLAAAPAASGFGTTDVKIRPNEGVYPHVTQAQPALASHGARVVAIYSDSESATTNYVGTSYSTDGGATWLRSTQPTGGGTLYGFGDAVWSDKAGRFFITSLASGCGGQGIGTWSSVDGTSWGGFVCGHISNSDDFQMLTVDNNPASPYYGRLYLAVNDFAVGGGAVRLTTSDTNGATWTAPVGVTSDFKRLEDADVTPDGKLHISVLKENGGGYAAADHLLVRSGDGGATFMPAVTVAGAQTMPGSGAATCGYFASMSPKWRYQGWGQLAPGAGGALVYAYTAHGAGADEGDVLVTRSTDGGATWSAPVAVSSSTERAQWQPSVTRAADGAVLVSWYDRRGSTNDDYAYRGRASFDGGITWGPDEEISDGVQPTPEQVDTNVQACFFGNGNRHAAIGDTVIAAWMDGRIAISGHQQMDIFTDRVKLVPPAATTQTPTGGQQTQTPTSTQHTPPPRPLPSTPVARAVGLRRLFATRGSLTGWLRRPIRLRFRMDAPGRLAVDASIVTGSGRAVAARTVRVARGSAVAARAGTVSVRLRLTKAGRRALTTARKRRRSVSLTVVATARSTTGAVGRSSGKLRLR